MLDDDQRYDVRRYPGDVLIEHGVIERLEDGTRYRLLGFEDLSQRERTVLVELCDARLRIYLAAAARASTAEEGSTGPGRVYILRSPATPTLFKVGFTTVRAEYRVIRSTVQFPHHRQLQFIEVIC